MLRHTGRPNGFFLWSALLMAGGSFGAGPAAEPARARARPAVATPPGGIAVVQQWQATGPMPAEGLEDRWFKLARQIGITAFQSYVHWSEIEPQPGVFDFGNYDPLVAKLRQHGLDWVPFVIAGPYYSTPGWFRDSAESVPARCLEHDRDNVIQSIWNPALRPHVQTYLKRLGGHYADQGVIAYVLLGISGNWGESLYPAGGGFAWKKEFHTHKGMWCGDEHAANSFRKQLVERYGSVEKLNRAWGSRHTSIDAITPKLAFTGSDAARLDLMHWYIDSMTEYAEFWIRSAKQAFPGYRIDLCTGGYGEPALGADFAAQARLCARYGGGVRITNQSNSYRDTYPRGRWLSTACRHYGTVLTTEPGGANSAAGVPMRVFDVLSSGADGLYFKRVLDNVFRGPYTKTDLADVLQQYRHLLHKRHPRIEVAAFYPQQSFLLEPRPLARYHKLCGRLRDLIDLDMVDESLIADGALEHYDALLVLPVGEIRPDTRAAIDRWREQAPARVVLEVDGAHPERTVIDALPDRIWADRAEDGVFHSRIDTGILALNTNREPVTDTSSGRDVRIAPHALALLPIATPATAAKESTR